MILKVMMIGVMMIIMMVIILTITVMIIRKRGNDDRSDYDVDRHKYNNFYIEKKL